MNLNQMIDEAEIDIRIYKDDIVQIASVKRFIRNNQLSLAKDTLDGVMTDCDERDRLVEILKEKMA